MKKVQTNCPNCGAVMDADKCKFCGTILYDFACLDVKSPFYMKIKKDNKIFRMKCFLNNAEMTMQQDESTDLYADNKLFYNYPSEIMTIHLDFQVMPVDGILYMVIDTDEIDPDTKAY